MKQRGRGPTRVTVGDVMVVPAESVGPTASFKAIARRLRERRISGMPVIDRNGWVLGVVSVSDLLAKEQRPALAARSNARPTLDSHSAAVKATGVVAAQLMTSPAVTVTPDVLVAEAAALMHRDGVRRLPVVDERGHLIGIVGRRDMLAVFLRSDDDLRRDVEQALWSTLGADASAIGVTVEQGMVRLDAPGAAQGRARSLEELVRDLDGVVSARCEAG